MRSFWIALIALGLAAAGCSSNNGASAGQGHAASTNKVWQAAQARLVHADSARFLLTTASGSTIDGAVTFQPDTMEMRIVTTSTGPKKPFMAMRRVGAILYINADDSGEQDHCWYRNTSTRPQIPENDINEAIGALRAAKAVDDPDGSGNRTRLDVTIPARAVASLLLLTLDPDLRAAVDKSDATVSLVIDLAADGTSVGFELKGDAAVKSLTRAGIDISEQSARWISGVRTTFTMTELNVPRAPKAPSDEQIIASDSDEELCPAFH